MGCFLALLAAISPRFVLILLFIFDHIRFIKVFHGNWFLPVIGFIFFPFTTLIYLFVYIPGIGLHGAAWLWIVLGVILDVTAYGGGFGARRNTPVAK